MTSHLDPDPLDVTVADRAYAAGFEDGWESTKPGRRGDRLALLAVIAAATALLITGIAIGRASAASRPGPQTTERVDLSALSSAGDRTGAPRAWMPVEDLEVEASGVVAVPAASVGAPQPTEPPAIASGLVAYATPAFGPRYLAIPEGPGIRVRICSSSSRCLDRVSTDAGPALFRQRQGRIGDVSYVDFAWLCRCSPPSRGLLVATIERTGSAPTPPATDVQP